MKSLKKSEIKKGYFLKKIILCIFWIVLLLAAAGGVKTIISGVYTTEDIFMTILCVIILCVTVRPIKKYNAKKNRCIPYFNTLLTKEELNELLEDEQFESIEYFKGTIFYKKIKESQHWLCVHDTYISKDLAVLCALRTQSNIMNNRSSTYLEVIYITGEMVTVDTGLGKVGKFKEVFNSYIKGHTDIIVLYLLLEHEAFSKSFANIVSKEPYKNMGIMDIIKHSEEIKNLCKGTLSQSTMKGYHKIKVD